MYTREVPDSSFGAGSPDLLTIKAIRSHAAGYHITLTASVITSNPGIDSSKRDLRWKRKIEIDIVDEDQFLSSGGIGAIARINKRTHESLYGFEELLVNYLDRWLNQRDSGKEDDKQILYLLITKIRERDLQGISKEQFANYLMRQINERIAPAQRERFADELINFLAIAEVWVRDNG